MIVILGTLLAGVLGLAFGSFLNVCASRWPDNRSARKGRSHCQGCQRQLEWWENVPLISWLALRGRCRTCKAAIGWRHLIVELAVGILWSGTVLQFFLLNPAPDVHSLTYTINLANLLAALGFEWLLVGLAAIDAENLWLPDLLILPGLALGFLLTITRAVLQSIQQIGGGFDVLKHMVFLAMVNWFLSAVAAAAVALVIRWIYIMFRDQEGLGMGDVKLLAMLGGWIGFKPAMLAFAIGVFACAGYAVSILAKPEMRANKKEWTKIALPFGSFISAGGIIAGIWGIPLIAAYSRWAGY